MSSIHGVGGNSPVQNVAGQLPARQAATTEASTPRSADKLELSGLTHLMQSLKANQDVRIDKVTAIKQLIESGTYEDEAKIDATVDRLLDELMK
jgi:anti-sigma28 factor (negative regulator of flagellin synthesis)